MILALNPKPFTEFLALGSQFGFLNSGIGVQSGNLNF